MAKDIFPQWMRMRLQMSASNTFTKKAFETPVIAGPNMYYIMNILKVYWIITAADGTTLVTAKSAGHTFQITRNEQADIINDDIDDLIFVGQNEHITLTSGAITGGWKMVDISDGAGHGVLVADKEIWMGIDADADSTTVGTARAWLLYTMQKVSPEELLDMLQED